VVKALERAAQELGVYYKKGVTVSNSGFFANQGRDVSRLPLTVPNIDGLLASIKTKIDNLKIENMEMEASFLLFFMNALGYRAGAICPVIANRRSDTFTACYSQSIRVAAQVALNALNMLRLAS
jgi:uridine phosphorylase